MQPDLPPAPDLPLPPVGIAGISLFLDFDGTLVDLAPRPDAVVVTAALSDRIDRLAAAMPGRVAIVSGRSLAQLDALLGPAARRIAVAGSHGAERRAAGGDPVATTAPAALAAATDALAATAADLDVVLERKTMGAALHYRARPGAEGAAIAAATAIAADHGLVLQYGKMMVEVRASGTKGDAVAALMAVPPAAGTRPLMFGDDVTDEDAFVVVASLGGAGVLVGTPRETAAHYRLGDPAALAAWLDQALLEAPGPADAALDAALEGFA